MTDYTKDFSQGENGEGVLLFSVNASSGSPEVVKSTSNSAHVTLSTNIAGEDVDADVLKIEKGENFIESVAASQTGQVLGAVGAVGDYIDKLIIVPATVAPGNVLLIDNATSLTVFTGTAAWNADLRPLVIPIEARSVSGAWSVTTGANVSVIAVGRFT